MKLNSKKIIAIFILIIWSCSYIPAMAFSGSEKQSIILAVLEAGDGDENNKVFNESADDDFYYSGTTEGKYTVKKGFLEILVNTLAEIFTFIINIVAYIIRMVFVGWTAIIENFITYCVELLTNTKQVLKVENSEANTNDNITIERIVFDEVKAFDINFFDIEEDEELEPAT